MVYVRAIWRLMGFAGAVFGGALTILLHFRRWPEAARQQAVQDWATRCLRRLGVQTTVKGVWTGSPALWVANHISWLDVLVLLSQKYCHLVAKAQVLQWPLIGLMARRAGTLFIDRDKGRDAMRVLHQMAQMLQDGHCVGVFPEGTTSDGQQLLPLHANLLHAAVITQCPVQAIGLRYVDAHSGELSSAANYIGEDHLLKSLWRIACAPALKATLNTEVLLPQSGDDRKKLADRLRLMLSNLLGIE